MVVFAIFPGVFNFANATYPSPEIEMSAIKHRQLGATAMAGDSDENYSDDESTPLTHDIYGGRYLWKC